jgi:large subunit ribosomal protein L6
MIFQKNCRIVKKKKIKSVQRTTVSLIKQLLIEAVALVYRKLKLVGVGYRVFPAENFEGHLLLLKLGYSHPIYFKIPSNLSIFCLKLTKLFLYGSSHQQVTSTASKIRLNKTPEPYKGKGILYDNEKIVLKEGKKV